jgi:hypothetical protein
LAAQKNYYALYLNGIYAEPASEGRFRTEVRVHDPGPGLLSGSVHT